MARDTCIKHCMHGAVLSEGDKGAMAGLFLALRDSVSRGHCMGLLSVARPSVRPWRNYLELFNGFLFKFGLLPPLAHTLRRFMNF